jgi:hypothetical protein
MPQPVDHSTPNTQRTLRILPDGYHEARHLDFSDEKLLMRLNLYSLGLLVPFVVLAFGWGAWVASSRGMDTNTTSWLLMWVFMLAVLPLHEWVHGLAIRYIGHRPRYGWKTTDVGRLKLPIMLYATADNAYFWRNDFILIALAPLVLLTLLGMALMWLLPNFALGIGLAIVLNGSGAVGDIWMTMITLRYPANTLVKDEEDAMRIFVRGNYPASVR